MHLKNSITSEPTNPSVKNVDDLIVKRKGGGSIIDHRPLFSNDGETLYVVWKKVIRTYSTQTGDFVREFEPTDNRIAAIAHYEDSLNTIIGCTETGNLMLWNCQNGLVTKKLKLEIGSDVKIRTFHIVHYTNPSRKYVCQALVSYVSKDVSKDADVINLTLLDLENGCSVTSKSTELICDNYRIDVIGNHGENYVALVQDVDVHIIDPARNLAGKIHKTGYHGRKLTCVAGHPEEACVATGDSSGRVVVWKGLFLPKPIQGTYHWHTLPVTEIAFSKSGGYMYTGGSECVLVKWILANPLQKSFLPRLPAPIKHLTIAPENLYVAVSTLDNGIIVVNPQRKLTAVIQNFTWGVATSRKDLFPAGLTLDPRTKCLVLNSRTGHVQFFDTHTKNLLYNINITAQNLLTQERSVIIVNTEVTKIALNDDGSWMSTVEERNDKISSIEVRLKFWKFDEQNQNFTLNTSIELPHESGVNALHFRPHTSLDGEHQLAVTTGKDNKFKLWNLAEPSSIHKTTKHWECFSMGEYRNLSATDAGFAMDGSLLGVGFGPSLTLWTPESNVLKASLTQSRYPQTITHVEFGRHESSHLCVVASSEHVAVWNLLTLSLTWSVPLKLTTLVADSNSTCMAAFTSDNSLFVFTPQSLQPVYSRTNLVDDDSSVLGGCFVPHSREQRGPTVKPWMRNSQLFFLDSNQELLTLESSSESVVSLDNVTTSVHVPATAFGSLVAAETTVSSTEKSSPYIHEHLGVLGKGMTEEFLSVPAHMQPPMRMLCVPFLLSLSAEIKRDKTRIRDDNYVGASVGTTGRDSTNDSDDDEEERVENTKDVDDVRMTNGYEKKDANANVRLSSFDWSFLSSILPSNRTQ